MFPIGTIREFQTAHFRVIIDAIDESDPDLSFDETGEVLEKVDSGEYTVFCARARVIHDTLGELATDYLGNCIYSDIADFQDHRQCAAETRKLRAEGSNAICGSYFADMIGEVCREARKRIQELQTTSASIRKRA